MAALALLTLPIFGVVTSTAAAEVNVMIGWNDPRIKYVGRWKSVESGIQNVFGGFCELRFTGSTSLSVAEKTNGVVAISVDGGAAERKELSGMPAVIAQGLSSGEHTVRIFTYGQHSRPVISGFSLDEGATLLEPVKRPSIEFVGDSVTEGYTGENADSHILSYAHLTAEQLGYDRNIVALGGITITPGYGYFSDKSGMVNRYFKAEMYGENAPDWDTALFVPDMLVINLGTNDRGQASSQKITESYMEFLKKLRAAYPRTPLFVMVPFCHDAQLTVAVEKVVEKTDVDGVYLIETASWGIDPGKDNTHPSKEEHVKAAQKLAQLLTYFAANGRLPDAAGSVVPPTTSQPQETSDANSRISSPASTEPPMDMSSAADREADSAPVTSEPEGETSSTEMTGTDETDSPSQTGSSSKAVVLKIVLGTVVAAALIAAAGFLVYALRYTRK